MRRMSDEGPVEGPGPRGQTAGRGAPHGRPRPGSEMTSAARKRGREFGHRGSGGAPDRATWSVVVFAMLFPACATWLWFVAFAGAPSMQLVYGISKAVQFGLPVAWFAAKRGREAQPRAADRTGAGTGAGIAFGLAAAGAILGAYGLVFRGGDLLGGAPAEIRQKVEQLGLATPLGYLGLATFYSVAHSGLEEYYWRWFVFGTLRRLVPPGAAVWLSAFAFTAHHVIVLWIYFRRAPWMVALASAAVAAGGAFWARLYDRSRSLRGPWLGHMLVDAALMAIGYDMLWPLY